MRSTEKSHHEAHAAPAADADHSADAVDWGRDAAARTELLIIDHVRRDPYAAAGIAFGVGLLAGGAMWKLFARSLLGLGSRLAISAIASAIFEQQPVKSREHDKR